MTAVEVEVTPGLDLGIAVGHVTEFAGQELLREFAAVMHEWGFRPFVEGRVRLPTLAEADCVLARSKYNQAS